MYNWIVELWYLNLLQQAQTDAIFFKTETWTHLPSRDVWNTTTSWVRIPNACLVIEGASPISEILFDSGLHIGLHENTGRNCWCSSSIGGMESLPFSAWDWVAEHPRMQPTTIFDFQALHCRRMFLDEVMFWLSFYYLASLITVNASNYFGRRMINRNYWSTHHYRNPIGVMLQHPIRGSIITG